MAGVIGTRSVLDSYVPGDACGGHGRPERGAALPRGVPAPGKPLPLGSLPDVGARAALALYESFGGEQPDGLDCYPVGHVVLAGQFVPARDLRAGREHAVHDGAAEVVRDAPVCRSGHANKLDEGEYSGTS
jgi:hypothetical protein